MSTIERLLKRTKIRKLLIVLFVYAIFFGSLIVLIEKDYPNANITNYLDSTWWTVTTITTVGYGDFYPVSPLGKFFGMALQIFGVILYASIVATISISLNRRQDEYLHQRTIERLDRIEHQLQSLSKESKYLIKKEVEGDKHV